MAGYKYTKRKINGRMRHVKVMRWKGGERVKITKKKKRR